MPSEPGFEQAVRRVVLGYRLVAVLWMSGLAAVALWVRHAPAGPVVGTVALAAVWSGWALSLARRPERLHAWPLLAVDTAVAAAAILAPAQAGVIVRFDGGYPFAAVVLAAWARGVPGALASGAVLAGATILRPLLLGGALPGAAAVDAVAFYLAAGGALAWGLQVLRHAEAARKQAQDALGEQQAALARAREREETAAHLHDSVLQTLALIQRRSSEPAQVTTLARSSERELRTWLGGRDTSVGAPSGVAAALANAAAEVEALFVCAVEVVTVGDAATGEDLLALVAAAREAITNAAKHAEVGQVAVFAEFAPGRAQVFVRDRGVGFDVGAVPDDRRGLAHSVVGRLQRHGGRAVVRSTLGEGTEVELSIPGAL